MHMHNNHRCSFSKIGWVVVLIGAINWGLTGLGYFFGGNWNIVNLIFGRMMWLEALIYVAVGVAGAWMIVGCRCANCKEGCETCKTTAPAAPSGGASMQGM